MVNKIRSKSFIKIISQIFFFDLIVNMVYDYLKKDRARPIYYY